MFSGQLSETHTLKKYIYIFIIINIILEKTLIFYVQRGSVFNVVQVHLKILVLFQTFSEYGIFKKQIKTIIFYSALIINSLL